MIFVVSAADSAVADSAADSAGVSDAVSVIIRRPSGSWRLEWFCLILITNR